MDPENPRDRLPAAEIEEVGGGRDLADRATRPGWRAMPGPAARAALMVGALAAAIVTAGLLGPHPAPPPESLPGSPAPTAPRPSSPAAIDAVTPTPIPLRRGADLRLADSLVLVAGRWMDLATGRTAAGAPDDCARARVLVLGGGRIVCVIGDVTRTPGSRIALFDLAVATVGAVRADPDVAPPAAPEDRAEPQALTSLVGQRDVVIGDPVAIAVAPGPGPDDLALAWAVIYDGRYEVGLEAFRLADADGRADRIGSWAIGRAPSVGRDAVDTLSDLAVAVDPGGSTALIGWTESRRGVAGPVRRLVAVPLAGSGPPVSLPADVTRNVAPAAADGPLRTVAPCGGGFGEGLVGPRTAYVVCPASPAELRVVDLGDAVAGVNVGSGPAAGGGAGVGPRSVVAAVPLVPGGTTSGTAWLAGNGVATDAGGSVVYRWSPAVGTVWRVEFDAAGAVKPRVAALSIQPLRGALETGVDGDAGPGVSTRPILALDAERSRLYALDAPVPRTGGRAVVHVIDLRSWRHLASFPVADTATRAVALSPDGRLLYASTEPRPADGAPLAVGVAVLDAATGAELAYAGRLPVSAGGPLQAVVVR